MTEYSKYIVNRNEICDYTLNKQLNCKKLNEYLFHSINNYNSNNKSYLLMN